MITPMRHNLFRLRRLHRLMADRLNGLPRLLVALFMVAVVTPGQAASGAPRKDDSTHLQRIVQQLDALDQEDLIRLVDEAEKCALDGDSRCAEARLRRARLYAHGKRDRDLLAKTRVFIDEELALQARETERREREEKQAARENECARYCPVPSQYRQCVAGQLYEGNCTDGSPTPSLADGMRDGLASAMAGAQRINNIHNQAMKGLQDSYTQRQREQVEQRERRQAREDDELQTRKERQAQQARERQARAAQAKAAAALSASAPAATNSPASAATSAAASRDLVAMNNPGKASPRQTEAQRYTYNWPGSLSSDSMHTSEGNARAEIALLAERARRGETEPLKINRGFIPDALSYEWIKAGPTRCEARQHGGQAVWQCWAETEYRVTALSPRPRDSAATKPATGIAR